MIKLSKLKKNYFKLTFKCLRDILLLKFNGFFQKLGEFRMNCMDLINGDQLKVVEKR